MSAQRRRVVTNKTETSALHAVKLALAAEMAKAEVTRADLAARLRVSDRTACRWLSLSEATDVNKLEAAFKALGRKLSIQVEAA